MKIEKWLNMTNVILIVGLLMLIYQRPYGEDVFIVGVFAGAFRFFKKMFTIE